MINLQVGDIVVYENRECRITKLTENEAELVNIFSQCEYTQDKEEEYIL